VNTSVLVCQNPKQQAPVELINSCNFWITNITESQPRDQGLSNASSAQQKSADRLKKGKVAF
jgi:hypothetical protein